MNECFIALVSPDINLSTASEKVVSEVKDRARGEDGVTLIEVAPTLVLHNVTLGPTLVLHNVTLSS